MLTGLKQAHLVIDDNFGGPLIPGELAVPHKLHHITAQKMRGATSNVRGMSQLAGEPLTERGMLQQAHKRDRMLPCALPDECHPQWCVCSSILDIIGPLLQGQSTDRHVSMMQL